MAISGEFLIKSVVTEITEQLSERNGTVLREL